METHVWHVEVKEKVMFKQRSKGWVGIGQENKNKNVPERREGTHKDLEVSEGMADHESSVGLELEVSGGMEREAHKIIDSREAKGREQPVTEV